VAGHIWKHYRAGAGVACLLLLQLPNSAAASGAPWQPLRNDNPFLQVFGLPAYEPTDVGNAGDWLWRFSMDISNHADGGDAPGESIVLDGESYRATLSTRFAVNEKLALGIDIPFVQHTGGFLDAPIENWHEFWGISNSKRSGPRNQLALRYDNPGAGSFDLSSPAGGIADIQFSASVQLEDSSRLAGRHLGLRAGIKLPTGDSSRLLGSGAVDTWVEANGSLGCAFGRDGFRLSAAAGLLFPGRGDVLPQLQRNVVGFGGFAAGWSLGERFEMQAQIHAQSAYYDSALEMLGGSSLQIALGGHYVFSDRKYFLSFAIVEDVFDNATTDVALYLSLLNYARAALEPDR
jgi:hypothetical protein